MTIGDKRLPPLTDAEESEVQRRIASDPDAPEATDEEMVRAKPFAQVFPDLHDSIQRNRGRPRTDDPKDAITLRLPRSVLERWQRDPDWRAKMADVLEKAAQQ